MYFFSFVLLCGMKNTVISIIYFLIGIICIILLNQSVFWPGFVSKALIIPVLIILFLANVNPLSNKLQKLSLAGLFFHGQEMQFLSSRVITAIFSNSDWYVFFLHICCTLL